MTTIIEGVASSAFAPQPPLDRSLTSSHRGSVAASVGKHRRSQNGGANDAFFTTLRTAEVVAPFVADMTYRCLAKEEYETTGRIRFHPFSTEHAVVMFVDISGYSKLSAALASKGAHALAVTVNRYFSQMIDVVHAFGGDVLKFAGDAMLVAWCGEDYKVHRRTIQRTQRFLGARWFKDAVRGSGPEDVSTMELVNKMYGSSANEDDDIAEESGSESDVGDPRGTEEDDLGWADASMLLQAQLGMAGEVHANRDTQQQQHAQHSQKASLRFTNAVAQGLRCCIALQQRCGVYEADISAHGIAAAEEGTQGNPSMAPGDHLVTLKLHIGLVAGELETSVLQPGRRGESQTGQIGGSSACFHSVGGPLMREIGAVLDSATVGEICVSPRVAAMLTTMQDRIFTAPSKGELQGKLPPRICEFLEVVNESSSSSPVPAYRVIKPAQTVIPLAAGGPDDNAVSAVLSDALFVHMMVHTAMLEEVVPDYAGVQEEWVRAWEWLRSRSPSGVSSSIDWDASWVQQHRQRRPLGIDELFVPAPVLRRIQSGIRPTDMAELRFLHVFFIKKMTQARLDDWFEDVYDVIQQHGASVAQVVDDDKGAHVIAVLGMFVAVHYAGDTAAAMSRALLKRANCVIGVAAGNCFCGVVGSATSACRWDVTGEPAVRACRLMQQAEKTVFQVEKERHEAAIASEESRRRSVCPILLSKLRSLEPAVAAAAGVETSIDKVLEGAMTQLGLSVLPAVSLHADPLLVLFDASLMETVSDVSTLVRPSFQQPGNRDSGGNTQLDQEIRVVSAKLAATMQSHGINLSTSAVLLRDGGGTTSTSLPAASPTERGDSSNLSTALQGTFKALTASPIRHVPWDDQVSIKGASDPVKIFTLLPVTVAHPIGSFGHSSSEAFDVRLGTQQLITAELCLAHHQEPHMCVFTTTGTAADPMSPVNMRADFMLQRAAILVVGPPQSGKKTLLMSVLRGTAFVPIVIDFHRGSSASTLCEGIGAWFRFYERSHSIQLQALRVLQAVQQQGSLSYAIEATAALIDLCCLHGLKIAIILSNTQFLDSSALGLIQLSLRQRTTKKHAGLHGSDRDDGEEASNGDNEDVSMPANGRWIWMMTMSPLFGGCTVAQVYDTVLHLTEKAMNAVGVMVQQRQVGVALHEKDEHDEPPGADVAGTPGVRHRSFARGTTADGLNRVVHFLAGLSIDDMWKVSAKWGGLTLIRRALDAIRLRTGGMPGWQIYAMESALSFSYRRAMAVMSGAAPHEAIIGLPIHGGRIMMTDRGMRHLWDMTFSQATNVDSRYESMAQGLVQMYDVLKPQQQIILKLLTCVGFVAGATCSWVVLCAAAQQMLGGSSSSPSPPTDPAESRLDTSDNGKWVPPSEAPEMAPSHGADTESLRRELEVLRRLMIIDVNLEDPNGTVSFVVPPFGEVLKKLLTPAQVRAVCRKFTDIMMRSPSSAAGSSSKSDTSKESLLQQEASHSLNIAKFALEAREPNKFVRAMRHAAKSIQALRDVQNFDEGARWQRAIEESAEMAKRAVERSDSVSVAPVKIYDPPPTFLEEMYPAGSGVALMDDLAKVADRFEAQWLEEHPGESSESGLEGVFSQIWERVSECPRPAAEPKYGEMPRINPSVLHCRPLRQPFRLVGSWISSSKAVLMTRSAEVPLVLGPLGGMLAAVKSHFGWSVSANTAVATKTADVGAYLHGVRLFEALIELLRRRREENVGGKSSTSPSVPSGLPPPPLELRPDVQEILEGSLKVPPAHARLPWDRWREATLLLEAMAHHSVLPTLLRDELDPKHRTPPPGQQEAALSTAAYAEYQRAHEAHHAKLLVLIRRAATDDGVALTTVVPADVQKAAAGGGGALQYPSHKQQMDEIDRAATEFMILFHAVIRSRAVLLTELIGDPAASKNLCWDDLVRINAACASEQPTGWADRARGCGYLKKFADQDEAIAAGRSSSQPTAVVESMATKRLRHGLRLAMASMSEVCGEQQTGSEAASRSDAVATREALTQLAVVANFTSVFPYLSVAQLRNCWLHGGWLLPVEIKAIIVMFALFEASV